MGHCGTSEAFRSAPVSSICELLESLLCGTLAFSNGRVSRPSSFVVCLFSDSTFITAVHNEQLAVWGYSRFFLLARNGIFIYVIGQYGDGEGVTVGP